MTAALRHVIFGTGAIGLATRDAQRRRGETARLVNRSRWPVMTPHTQLDNLRAPPLTRGKLVVLIHPDTPGTPDSRSTP
jgi:hypothetical protein